jgi:hypothetical protein
MPKPRIDPKYDDNDSIHPGGGGRDPSTDETSEVDLRGQAESTVVMRPAMSPEQTENQQGAEATPPEADPDALKYCPDCGNELSDPFLTGWCMRCGYCRYLENPVEIAPVSSSSFPLSPETKFLVDLLRSLSGRMKGRRSADPAGTAANMDLINALSKRISNPRSAANVPQCRDLINALARKMDGDSGGADQSGGYFALLHAMSQKLKDEMEGGKATRRASMLNLPVPGLELVPEWLAVLACGLLICALGSLMVGFNLRGAPQMRALWATAQGMFAIGLLLLSYSAAFFLVVPRGLRFKQWTLFILPNSLWWAVWQRLPETSWALWLLSWGAALGLGAVLIMLL